MRGSERCQSAPRASGSPFAWRATPRWAEVAEHGHRDLAVGVAAREGRVEARVEEAELIEHEHVHRLPARRPVEPEGRARVVRVERLRHGLEERPHDAKGAAHDAAVQQRARPLPKEAVQRRRRAEVGTLSL
eukprot:6586153-Prymnesium_polylepis.1